MKSFAQKFFLVTILAIGSACFAAKPVSLEQLIFSRQPIEYRTLFLELYQPMRFSLEAVNKDLTLFRKRESFLSAYRLLLAREYPEEAQSIIDLVASGDEQAQKKLFAVVEKNLSASLLQALFQLKLYHDKKNNKNAPLLFIEEMLAFFECNVVDELNARTQNFADNGLYDKHDLLIELHALFEGQLLKIVGYASIIKEMVKSEDEEFCIEINNFIKERVEELTKKLAAIFRQDLCDIGEFQIKLKRCKDSLFKGLEDLSSPLTSEEDFSGESRDNSSNSSIDSDADDECSSENIKAFQVPPSLCKKSSFRVPGSPKKGTGRLHFSTSPEHLLSYRDIKQCSEKFMTHVIDLGMSRVVPEVVNREIAAIKKIQQFWRKRLAVKREIEVRFVDEFVLYLAEREMKAIANDAISEIAWEASLTNRCMSTLFAIEECLSKNGGLVGLISKKFLFPGLSYVGNKIWMNLPDAQDMAYLHEMAQTDDGLLGVIDSLGSMNLDY